MEIERPSWDKFYMTMAYLASSRSKDRSTHAGSAIAAPDKTIRAVGYNDLPRGIEYEGEIGTDGLPSRRSSINGEKYLWVEHSERNAIYNAGRNGVSVIGCTLYVNWLPCEDCARAMIQSGISEVVIHRQGQEAFMHSRGGHDDIWADAHGVVWTMMTEAGLHVRWFEEPMPGVKGYFSGHVYTFSESGDPIRIPNQPNMIVK